MRITKQLREDARAYYALCSRARALGIPVSLDNPDSPNSPKTVQELKDAVAMRER